MQGAGNGLGKSLIILSRSNLRRSAGGMPLPLRIRIGVSVLPMTQIHVHMLRVVLCKYNVGVTFGLAGFHAIGGTVHFK